MRTRVLVAVAVLVVAAGGVAVWLARPSGDGTQPAAKPSAGLATRTVQAGGVQVAIQPLQLDQRGAAFQVTLTTHSGRLDVDVAGQARLQVDGIAWGGASWSGSPPGGHHRQGTLRFAPGSQSGAARTASLRIGGLPAPVEATWQLAGGSP